MQVLEPTLKDRILNSVEQFRAHQKCDPDLILIKPHAWLVLNEYAIKHYRKQHKLTKDQECSAYIKTVCGVQLKLETGMERDYVLVKMVGW